MVDRKLYGEVVMLFRQEAMHYALVNDIGEVITMSKFYLPPLRGYSVARWDTVDEKWIWDSIS